MENRVPTRLSRAEARKFGFVLGGAFAALAGIVWWRGHASLLPVFAGIAGVLIVLAVAWPVALRPVHRAWMAFGLQLSRITTPIFMGLVYFLAVLPIGVLRRTFGSNPIVHAEREQGFWAIRDGQRRRGNLTRQF